MTAKSVAVLALAALLAVGGVSGGQAARGAKSVLALTYVSGSGWSQLGPVDPFTLRPLGDAVRLRGSVESWSFSPDGKELAVAGRSTTLSIVDARSLRVRTELRLAARGIRVQAVSWLRPARLLAVVTLERGMLVVAVDPQAGRIVHTTLLRRQYGYASGRLHDRLAFLLDSGGRIAPARVAFSDADGRVRVATLRRMLNGSAVSRTNGVPRVRERVVGFAVDPAGDRAYMVDRDFVVAEIDARTLAVRYHAPTERTAAAAGRLEKLIEGSVRTAAWLGGGLLVAGGVDWKLEGRRSIANPRPIRLIDIRDWSFRTLEARSGGLRVASGLVLVQERNGLRAFAADGSERYRTALPTYAWLVEGDGLLYICRSLALTTVLDAATGTVVRSAAQLKGSPCARVLVAQASPS